MDQIRQYSNKFQVILILMAVAYPAWELIIWGCTYNLPEWILSTNDMNLIGPIETSGYKRLVCWVSGVPAQITWVYMALVFYKVLANYKKLEIFTEENARRYQSMGKTGLLFMLFAWLNGVTINVVFSIYQDVLSNILTEINLIYFVGAIISFGVIFVGWVMQEAHKLAEANKGII